MAYDVIIVYEEERAGVEVVTALTLPEEVRHLGELAMEVAGQLQLGRCPRRRGRLAFRPVEEVVQQRRRLRGGQVQAERLD